jgi:hypothetical protein
VKLFEEQLSLFFYENFPTTCREVAKLKLANENANEAKGRMAD